MPLELIKSEKGRGLLVHEYHTYSFERKINSKPLMRYEYH